jgi:hypothetical protein
MAVEQYKQFARTDEESFIDFLKNEGFSSAQVHTFNDELMGSVEGCSLIICNEIKFIDIHRMKDIFFNCDEAENALLESIFTQMYRDQNSDNLSSFFKKLHVMKNDIEQSYSDVFLISMTNNNMRITNPQFARVLQQNLDIKKNLNPQKLQSIAEDIALQGNTSYNDYMIQSSEFYSPLRIFQNLCESGNLKAATLFLESLKANETTIDFKIHDLKEICNRTAYLGKWAIFDKLMYPLLEKKCENLSEGSFAEILVSVLFFCFSCSYSNSHYFLGGDLHSRDAWIQRKVYRGYVERAQKAFRGGL